MYRMIKSFSLRRAVFWLLLLLLYSCSNEIDLFTVDYEKSYVVFGFINCTDGDHQVKIRKTSVHAADNSTIYQDEEEFLPPSRLTASIIESSGNGVTGYDLHEVLYGKNPGPFFLTGNVVHEVSFATDPDRLYTLKIVDPEMDVAITAETSAIPDPKLVTPSWPFIRYGFSSEADPFTMRVKSVPRIYIYLFSFRVHYLEVMKSGDSILQLAHHDFPPRYVDKPPVYNPKRATFGHDVGISVSLTYTLNLLREMIPDIEDLDHRQLQYFEVTVWGGDRYVKDFYLLNERFSDNRKFQFGNVDNGIGYFGAVSHTGCIGIYPDHEFMDSLLYSPKYSGLKFIDGFYERR